MYLQGGDLAKNMKAMTSSEIMTKIKDNLGRIRGYGTRRIGVFGSGIRDELTPKSDIDILVEFEEGKKTFDNYMDLLFFLEEIFNCKVDLVIKESIKPELEKYILEEVKYAS
jgi:predicted nucleotidyltransferase